MQFPNPKEFVRNAVQIGWYGMGFDNITSTYKIVRVSKIVKKERYGYYSTIGMVTHILVLGTNSWREIPSVPPSGLNCASNVCAAYGDMHWLKRRVRGAGKSHIISFDFKKEEFYWTPTPKLHKHSYALAYSKRMYGVCGDLFITRRYEY